MIRSHNYLNMSLFVHDIKPTISASGELSSVSHEILYEEVPYKLYKKCFIVCYDYQSLLIVY